MKLIGFYKNLKILRNHNIICKYIDYKRFLKLYLNGNHLQLFTCRNISRSDSYSTAVSALSDKDCKLAMSHCAATPLDDGDAVAGAISATLAFDGPDGGDCVARWTSVALFLGAGAVALAVDALPGGEIHKILNKSWDSKEIIRINANHNIISKS